MSDLWCYTHPMITYMDRCLSCNCAVELDFVPGYESDTICALCDVEFYELAFDFPFEGEYEDDWEYDPDYLRDW